MNEEKFEESIDRVKSKAFDSLSCRLKKFEVFHSDSLAFLERLQDAIWNLQSVTIEDDDDRYRKIVELIKQGYNLYNKYDSNGRVLRDEHGIQI